MLRCLLPIFLAAAGPALAGAPDLATVLTFPPGARIVTQSYRCAGGPPFPVHYVTAGPNDIALVPIGGTTRIMVAVLAASGVRYVSGPYEWWTKGESATLSDKTSRAAGTLCQAARP